MPGSFGRCRVRGGREGGREIFSETARKLPVQLNRKQYENLFESFDYTKEATVDAGKAEEREGQKGRGGIPGQGQGGGGREALRDAGETMGQHQTCKTDRIFTFKLNYFPRFVYD